jgi:hypothetical protein
VDYSRVMLAYCRLEQAGHRLIAALQDTVLQGPVKDRAVAGALARLKRTFKRYLQARSTTEFTCGSTLEGELDKVGAVLARQGHATGRSIAARPAP